MKKVLFFLVLLFSFSFFRVDAVSYDYQINLDDLKVDYYYETDFEKFKSDYKNAKLKDIYVTDFLFDGVDAVKNYDLDDFKDNENFKPSVLNGTVLNINRTGNIEITGTLENGMVAVNTNKLKGDLKLYLNNARIDTKKKYWPAIYVYNNNINYKDINVSINTLSNTKNYITGGRLKKVSLMSSKECEEDSRYSSEYYNVYRKKEMGEDYKNILFARIKADKEGIKDGDPTVYYKSSGAISSDIKLTFEGDGYLSVTSYNKEGIEGKNDLVFHGGDYYIFSLDDAINTTTSKESSMYNTFSSNIVIDVNKLVAVVSPLAKEGDAIDSNGRLTINSGEIYAISNPHSHDSGLDALEDFDLGEVYINGGTILSTGNMKSNISEDSKQNYILFNVNHINKGDLVALKDDNNIPIFAFKTDRKFSNIVFSSNLLTDNNYYVYKNGDIDALEEIIVDKNDTNLNHSFTKYKDIKKYENGEKLYENIEISNKDDNSFLIKLLILCGSIVLGFFTSLILFKIFNNISLSDIIKSRDKLILLYIYTLLLSFLIFNLIVRIVG